MNYFCFELSNHMLLAVLETLTANPVHGVEPGFSTMNHLALVHWSQVF
jgi:hypothetical protein